MKHWKRFSALVLTLALLAALVLTVPVSAASVSSFDDITDPTVGVNADVLRFMGVVSGTGDNRFNPSGTLTRAEFCTMLVIIMGRAGEAAGQSTRTIFTDVTAAHWARGYVNLAASITVDGSAGGTRLISGVGGGRFEPDRAINFGEAVTILIRVLGYTDDQVGYIWPQDYVSKAGEIGLSAGVNASATGSITRAQAAQMFVNLLSCKRSDASSCYYETLGQATQDVILLSVSGELNGVSGAVRTSEGTYLPASTSQLPASFVGQRGVQVIGADNRIVAFIPASGRSVTITLAAAAKSTSLQATDGTTYTISPKAEVFGGGNASYAAIFSQLSAGTQVTLYLNNGAVEGLYYVGAGTGSTLTDDAVIVSGTASAAMFYQLTGGASDYKILKDRQEITLKDIQENDVAVYDPVSNTLLVSDLRITVGYLSADNTRAPTAIEVMGVRGTHKDDEGKSDGMFEVLTCAVDSVAGFRTGDIVTLLLTADGRVAQAVAPTASLRSTAVGLVGKDGRVEIPLPAGGSLTTDAVSNELHGQLVTVSSTRTSLSAVRLTSRTAPGDFDVENMTLGEYTVAAGAALYERVGANGAAVPLDLTGLEITSIPASKVSAYSLNTSNMVDVLVVDNVTGNAYVYGILDEDSITQSSGGGLDATNRTVKVDNGKGGLEHENGCMTGMSFTKGTYGGVAVGSWDSLNGINRAADIVTLTEVKNVPVSAFYTANGVTYVSVGGRVYPVAVGVVCRDGSADTSSSTADSWLAPAQGEDNALSEALSVGSSFTLYIDPIAGMVRVVVIQSR